jgi:hypothetical protein
MTGEPGDLVPVCLGVLSGLDDGRFEPVMIPAAWALVEAGARLEMPVSDRRFARFVGWRAFDDDEDLRQALRQL